MVTTTHIQIKKKIYSSIKWLSLWSDDVTMHRNRVFTTTWEFQCLCTYWIFKQTSINLVNSNTSDSDSRKGNILTRNCIKYICRLKFGVKLWGLCLIYIINLYSSVNRLLKSIIKIDFLCNNVSAEQIVQANRVPGRHDNGQQAELNVERPRFIVVIILRWVSIIPTIGMILIPLNFFNYFCYHNTLAIKFYSIFEVYNLYGRCKEGGGSKRAKYIKQ